MHRISETRTAAKVSYAYKLKLFKFWEKSSECSEHELQTHLSFPISVSYVSGRIPYTYPVRQAASGFGIGVIWYRGIGVIWYRSPSSIGVRAPSNLRICRHPSPSSGRISRNAEGLSTCRNFIRPMLETLYRTGLLLVGVVCLISTNQ